MPKRENENIGLDIPVVIVKIGGSSITNKAKKESVNQESLDWFARIVSQAASDDFKNTDDSHPQQDQVAFLNTPPGKIDSTSISEPRNEPKHNKSTRKATFILVHGAGSFGHHSAKEYGLSGQSEAPNNCNEISFTERKRRMRGLSETRLSVQKLNQLVVASLLDYGVSAVGISPGFGVPGLEAHVHLQTKPIQALESVILKTLNAGLVPVLHGDACLFGNDAAILSGDTIMEVLGTLPWVSDAIFITDVDGVFSEDPNENPNAKLLKHISVDPKTGEIKMDLKASGSSHEHDVTGGLETKLKAAATIAKSKDVTIVGCGSQSAEDAMKGDKEVEFGTVISPLYADHDTK